MGQGKGGQHLASVVKQRVEDGLSNHEINGNLLMIGMIKKPLSRNYFHKLRTGRTHKNVLPKNLFISINGTKEERIIKSLYDPNDPHFQTDAWIEYLRKWVKGAKQNYPNIKNVNLFRMGNKKIGKTYPFLIAYNQAMTDYSRYSKFVIFSQIQNLPTPPEMFSQQELDQYIFQQLNYQADKMKQQEMEKSKNKQTFFKKDDDEDDDTSVYENMRNELLQELDYERESGYGGENEKEDQRSGRLFVDNVAPTYPRGKKRFKGYGDIL